VIIVTRPWFEFGALVIKLFSNANDLVHLGEQDIRGLITWPTIRLIAMLAKAEIGSSF
jgi:hypothetical protein